jgi:hypothetical protein
MLGVRLGVVGILAREDVKVLTVYVDLSVIYNQMPNPFLISILTLITTLATTPTIANTNLNAPNKTTTIVGSNLQANTFGDFFVLKIVVLFLMRG